MVLLIRGEAANVIVTASEKAVLPDTVYSLLFVHDLTKKEVAFPDVEDQSLFPERYNKFIIDTSAFDEVDSGFLSYYVKDQDSNILEEGKALLRGEKPTSTQYNDTPTEYKTYGE